MHVKKLLLGERDDRSWISISSTFVAQQILQKRHGLSSPGPPFSKRCQIADPMAIIRRCPFMVVIALVYIAPIWAFCGTAAWEPASVDHIAGHCGFVCPCPKVHQIDHSCAATTMAEEKRKSLEIFILSGQSNMSGRGGIITIIAEDGSKSIKWDGVVPAECAAEPGAILRLNKDQKWEEAHEPLHEDIDLGKPCGVGPGLVFAASLLRARKYKVKPTGPQIGLVPCAIGGTSITEWEKGGELYTHMVERTKAALAQGGTLKALLWYQGESDSVEKSRAEHYEDRLKVFFNNVREELENHDLPILQVAIQWPTAEHPEFVEKVRDAQKAVAEELKNVHVVDALGLPLASDNIHLTTEAQTKVGLMLLDKFISTGEGRHS